jgi:hypothetical protein
MAPTVTIVLVLVEYGEADGHVSYGNNELENDPNTIE